MIPYMYKVSYCYLRNPRFVQRTQEDSHEALRCLFDAIKNEEIEVCMYVCMYVCFINIIILYMYVYSIDTYTLINVHTYIY